MIKVLCFLSTFIGLHALEEGKSYVDHAQALNSDDVSKEMATSGIAVDPKPKESHINSTQALVDATKTQKDTNDFFKTVKDQQSKRPKMESFDISGMLNADKTGDLVETPGKGALHTCRTPGDSYTKTCTKHREVVLELTPKKTRMVQGHCNQHWVNKVTGKKRTCKEGEGCRAPREEVLQHRAVRVVKDAWVGCEELDKMDDQNQAHIVDEVIVDGAGTKMIPARSDDGALVEEEPITRDAWEIRRVYQIKSGVTNTCKVFQKLGYTLIKSTCLETDTTDDGINICKVYENTYESAASSNRRDAVGYTDKNPLEGPVKTPNANLFKALSTLEGLHQMAKSMEGAPVFSIFKGDVGKCTTNFGGSFKNCCEGVGGVGTKFKLATGCSGDEQQLQQWRKEGRCVYLGNVRKNKTMGINFSSEKVFCCFPSKIARLIQEQGRAQLGLTFGTATAPNCRGLTPDELKAVDFGKLDLSEAFSDLSTTIPHAQQVMRDGLIQSQKNMSDDAKTASIKQTQKTMTRGEY